ncbi:hypothetical protein KFK09_008205 [Dendrobium nobile]|uniref:Uncharacterized protein n=1 Tax=Dendrobium nobile TaxID=94219 RepID=A0A8T3BPA7_DENNO|nr:hypothetical protein KFK09_008205 [Dendrobium nobile]
MYPFVIYFIFCTLSYNTVWVKGNSPPPLVAIKPPPPPPVVVPVPPKWPYHLNFSTGVEGVVFCAACSKLSGFNKSINAAPLRGAEVKLLCFERQLEQIATEDPILTREKPVELKAEVKTDERGYFFIRVAKIKPSLIKTCRIYVLPPIWCSKIVFPKTDKRDRIIPKFPSLSKLFPNPPAAPEHPKYHLAVNHAPSKLL